MPFTPAKGKKAAVGSKTPVRREQDGDCEHAEQERQKQFDDFSHREKAGARMFYRHQ
jgi:hypothetical protein